MELENGADYSEVWTGSGLSNTLAEAVVTSATALGLADFTG